MRRADQDQTIAAAYGAIPAPLFAVSGRRARELEPSFPFFPGEGSLPPALTGTINALHLRMEGVRFFRTLAKDLPA